MALVTFYDVHNNEIDKFPLLTQEASWVENKPGRLVFNMPLGHDGFAYKYLKWGVKVTAQFDWFKPLWVGFVEPPRKWQQGNIVVNCRSMEYIFHHRRQRDVTTEGKLTAPLLLKGPGGALVKQILQIANSKRSTFIVAGNINMGGEERQETVDDLLDFHLTNIAKRTGSVWNVTANNVGGALQMYLNYFPQRDRVIDYLIEEGVNLETQQTGDILVEDGDIPNDVLGTGDESVREEVLAFIAEDKTAMNQFGLRQTIVQFPGNVESGTIKENTVNYLRDNKEAIKSINPVLPYNEEVASRLMLNTMLPVRLHSVGFKANGTIGFDGYAPVRSLTIDEVRERISLIVGTDDYA